MINYSKARQSVQKNSSKKSLTRISINKSHTSSMNIKLSQDLSYIDNMKIPLKNLFKEKCDLYPTDKAKPSAGKYGNTTQKQKFSIKLQTNQNKQKENLSRRKQAFDGTTAHIKPFQQCNRYMETERYSKEHYKNIERSLSKNAGVKIKTQYVEPSCQKYRKEEPSCEKYKKDQPSCEKYKKEVSTKQTNSSSNQFMRISVTELRSALHEYTQCQKQIQALERQLKFYKKHCHVEMTNSVMSALKA